jgi:uncharacterized protein involved in tolerance to divalent cations
MVFCGAAAAARGARLCSVNPGIVFNSRTHTLPQWSSIRSTRDSPSASIAWAALMAVSQILWESWQGKLESSVEALAIFKLSSERYADFESKLQSLHPYDVPEIVCLEISKGLPDYLRWVTESCGPLADNG